MRILKIGLSIYVFILCLILYSREVYSQVVINEFSSGSSSDDWVEIHVLPQESPLPHDLSLYKLVDAADNEKILSSIIDPGGFAAFDWSNRLNNDGDEIKLILISSNEEINTVSYGDEGGICAAESGQSIGRSPDGSGNFVRFSSSTKAASNSSSSEVLCSTPTPDPTPTATPKPTSTPTKFPTPPPTQKPTATPRVTPKSTLKATSTPKTSETEETNQEDEVASVVFETSSPSPIGEVAGVSDEQNSFPVVAILPVLVGLGLVGFSGVSLFKRRALIKEFIDSQSNKTN